MPPINQRPTAIAAARPHLVDVATPAALAALSEVHGVALTADAVRSHVIAPANVADVISNRGIEEGPALAAVQHLDLEASLLRFDDAQFADDLHAALKDEVAGYAMQLRRHGSTIRTLQWNWAKEPTDGGEGWTPSVRMHVASCSKLVTAMAMTRLLLAHGISFDTPIAPHLPSYWAKGPNVDKITFRQLMTHTSGFRTGVSSSDFEFMKGKVAAGVTSANLGGYGYENMNFGLCRILLATINGNISPGTTFDIPFIPNGNDIVWDYVTVGAYADYCAANLFSPAGVSGPSLDHPSPDALAYTFPVTLPGWNSGDLRSMAGGAAWHMSVDDLLRVMHTYRKGAAGVSNAQAQGMLDDGFGIDLIVDTGLGRLYNKNGLWQSGSGNVEQSLAYFLPQDMELVVLANSPIGSDGKFFRSVVTDIVTANIKPRPLRINPRAIDAIKA